ncbi:unnamed protein product, partial [Linum tenue]
GFLGLTLAIVCMSVVLPAPLTHATAPPSSSYVKGRVAYYRMTSGLGTPTGACGYGETGAAYNYGNVADASSKLWKNGTVCGACYQVIIFFWGRISEGVNIVVTDRGFGDKERDFILSSHALQSMALPNKVSKLLPKSLLDVKYKRVPCRYPGHDNLMVKVTEQSVYGEHLSIVLVYQGGQYDVLGIQIYGGSVKQWKDMKHEDGAVYDFPNPPKGPISLKLKLKDAGLLGGVVKFVKLDNVIPRHWKAGVAYDSKVKLA